MSAEQITNVIYLRAKYRASAGKVSFFSTSDIISMRQAAITL
jgi:hypothetical protein